MSAPINWRCLGTLKPIHMAITGPANPAKGHEDIQEAWAREIQGETEGGGFVQSGEKKVHGGFYFCLTTECCSYGMRGCSADRACLVSQESTATQKTMNTSCNTRNWLSVRGKKITMSMIKFIKRAQRGDEVYIPVDFQNVTWKRPEQTALNWPRLEKWSWLETFRSHLQLQLFDSLTAWSSALQKLFHCWTIEIWDAWVIFT